MNTILLINYVGRIDMVNRHYIFILKMTKTININLYIEGNVVYYGYVHNDGRPLSNKFKIFLLNVAQCKKNNYPMIILRVYYKKKYLLEYKCVICESKSSYEFDQKYIYYFKDGRPVPEVYNDFIYFDLLFEL